jgi:hypothetical protein
VLQRLSCAGGSKLENHVDRVVQMSIESRTSVARAEGWEGDWTGARSRSDGYPFVVPLDVDSSGIEDWILFSSFNN